MEVHPPDHAVHTWRDVLTHLGIVTLGLLIALSLEGLVEVMHHRHLVRETRENLEAEQRINEAYLHTDVLAFRRVREFLHTNIRILLYIKQHPGTPAAQLPGKLIWLAGWEVLTEAEWHTANQTGATALMDQKEVARFAEVYVGAEELNKAWDLAGHHMFRLGGYQHVDPDPTHLTPAQIDELLQGCGVAVGELQVVAAEISNVSRTLHPSTAPEITRQEMLDIDK